MDQGLSIAVSALNADRAEIDVASQNIANAQTPGYSSESATLQTLPPAGSLGIGTGVEVAGVSQASNAMLAANAWQTKGALSSLTSLQTVLQGIEDVFPLGQQATSSSATGSANSGIAGQLANFWSAWDAVAADPTSAAARAGVISDAQGLVTTIGEASVGLTQLQQNTVGQLSDNVASLNSLLSEAASVNQQIVSEGSAGTNTNELQDQLHNILGQLSSVAGVTVHMNPDRTANVSIGGVTVVQESSASSVRVVDNSGTYGLTTSAGVPVAPQSGSVAGLLSGLNQQIPSFSAQLDQVASVLASTVNTQLAQGYTASGASGAGYPLFVGNSAASLAVNQAVVADPTLIAAASTSGAASANDGSNAQAMAELASSSTGPDSIYQSLVQTLGTATETANTQVNAQSAVANAAQAALDSATGVNLDAELTNLMNFQSNYEASAKLLTVLDATMQALVQAV